MATMRSLILKISISIFVFGVFCAQPVLVFATSVGDSYFLAQKSFYLLKASPEKQKFRHHWMNTIKMFLKVVDHFPKSGEAYKAEFTIGKLYEALSAISKNPKDLEKASYHYNKVFRNFPPGNLSDDALFRIAEIYLVKKQLASASEIFKKIVTKYPKGDQAKKAQQKYKSIKVVAKSKNTDQIAPVNIQSQRKLTSFANRDLALKKVGSLETNKGSERFIVGFKNEIQKENSEKHFLNKSITSLRIKPTRQVSRKALNRTIDVPNTFPSKKIVNVKDGFGRGYLYNPKTPKKKQATLPLIVVDAGHGGKDDGAMSASGIKEKDINLKISKHVKTILVSRYKYRVVMTRKDDTFIPLKDRSKISNRRNADLFVSIHANAAKRKSAHGIETYFLGTSNNKQALATAARENGDLVKSVNDDQVQQILASLITTTKINDSSRLAGRVQENLYKTSKKTNRNVKNLGVKEGPFYVLHGADMPSILVEVGFLTNPKEAKMLAKPEYLYKLASSIAEGIHKYMKDKGPSI